MAFHNNYSSAGHFNLLCNSQEHSTVNAKISTGAVNNSVTYSPHTGKHKNNFYIDHKSNIYKKFNNVYKFVFPLPHYNYNRKIIAKYPQTSEYSNTIRRMLLDQKKHLTLNSSIALEGLFQQVFN